MTTESFRRRGTALEDEFFHRVDQRLAEKLRAKWKHERDVESLKRESHFTDTKVVEELLAAGITPGTLQAMMLVPHITVAWANGFVEDKERDAVMHAAQSVGVVEQSITGQLLAAWLQHKPGPELFAAWRDYISALKDVMHPDTFGHLRQTTLQKTQEIAKAAGGVLGIHTVSQAEQTVLDLIEQSFNAA
ncbi:MAG: hypothetical protein KDA81_05885 [Planctomycetaceae bacterium]|nr:hypothetical protein [Planctomycetaceae bacterium]